MEPQPREKVSLTIKGVPARLRSRLAVRAAESHRSLNGEILHILEAAVEDHEPGRLASASALARIRELRTRIRGPGLSPEEVDAAIAQGRP
jgi:plasmid stability protein